MQCDERRTVALLELLHELSRERQVILFTQESDVLTWAGHSLIEPDDRLVKLDGAVGSREPNESA